jgi:hypothetical protein
MHRNLSSDICLSFWQVLLTTATSTASRQTDSSVTALRLGACRRSHRSSPASSRPAGGAVSQSYVDSADLATPVAAKNYTDQQPGTSIVTSHDATGTNLDYDIFRFGSIEIALGVSNLEDGDSVQPPPGFVSAAGKVTCCLCTNFR